MALDAGRKKHDGCGQLRPARSYAEMGDVIRDEIEPEDRALLVRLDGGDEQAIAEKRSGTDK